MLFRKKAIILMYHGFTDRKAEGLENCQAKHIDVEKFKKQLSWLKKYYKVISLEQLIENYRRQEKIPAGCVVITIDDGYESTYRLAYPLLKSFNLTATVFLTVDFINRINPLWVDRVDYVLNKTGSRERMLRGKLKLISQEKRDQVIKDLEDKTGISLSFDEHMPAIYRPLKWEQIKEMAKSRIISFGSHTLAHVIISRCEQDRAKKELCLSKKSIEQNIGKPCRLFCYPDGQKGSFNSRTKELLKEAGYICGLTTIPGMADQNSDIFELKRLGVSNRDNLIAFIAALWGLKFFLGSIKRLILNFIRKS